MITKESPLGKLLDNPKASEILANHKDFKGKSVLIADIYYTKCDLDVIKKCIEGHEKTSKARNYDSLSTMQKVGVAFATIIPIVGNAIAYYGMKSYNKSEKNKLEVEIAQSLDGIKGDLDALSTKPKQPKELEVGRHSEKDGLNHALNKIRDNITSHILENPSGSPNVGGKKTGGPSLVVR